MEKPGNRTVFRAISEEKQCTQKYLQLLLKEHALFCI